MLFNFSKNTNKPQETDAILAGMFSDGINLSINELIQYQSKAKLINLTPKKTMHGKMSGNYLARSKGRGMEFDEVRHYQTGDDIRAIDWRVTARTGKTHTKLFREEIERPVLIATDLTNSMLFGSQLLFKSVQAAHIAALVAWHAKQRGDRIGGLVFNQEAHSELKPRSRKEGVLHYLHALVKLHQQGISHQFGNKAQTTNVSDHQQTVLSFEKNCARIRQLSRPGSLIYLITDGHSITDEAVRHLSHISRHCELIVCLVSDSLEHELPVTSHKINVAVTDGINKQQLTLGDHKTTTQYKEKALKRDKGVQRLFEKSGARLISFDSGSTIETQLKNGRVI